MALIAHTLHFSKEELLDLNLDDIHFWADKADKLLSALYKQEKQRRNKKLSRSEDKIGLH